MRRQAFLTVVALSCVATGPAFADDVDGYIELQMQRRHIPGVSLAVVKDGKVLKAKGYGLANVETGTAATTETVYKIASISKQFVAAGIMLLVQDGKLGLDDKVSKYLDGTPEAWKDITIRHLLAHTSGLVADPPGFEPFKARPDADVVKSSYATKLLTAPGEKWSYSNLGYFALGEVIRKRSGKPWGEFVADRVFAPASMTATRTTTTTDIVPRRAAGYAWKEGKLERAEDWVAVRPSGGFLSTVLDLAKWDAALGSEAVLASSLRDQMWTPVRLNDGTTHPYGLGWELAPWQGHRRVYHRGGLPGFLSDFERFVDDKLTVIVMINSTSGDPAKIALNVAGLYVPALAPVALKPIADAEPEVTSKIKALIAGLVDRNPDLALFTPEIIAWLKAGGGSGMSNAFRDPGPIRSIELVERKIDGDKRTYRYRVIYPDDNLFATFHFNKDGKITGFGIETE